MAGNEAPRVRYIEQAGDGSSFAAGMMCFAWLVAIFLMPMSTAPPITILAVLLNMLLMPPTRPCLYCTLLFLLFLFTPMYGGENWPRWMPDSILRDVQRNWQVDSTGRLVPGFWQATQAWTKFLFATRPHPVTAPPLSI